MKILVLYILLLLDTILYADALESKRIWLCHQDDNFMYVVFKSQMPSKGYTLKYFDMNYMIQGIHTPRIKYILMLFEPLDSRRLYLLKLIQEQQRIQKLQQINH